MTEHMYFRKDNGFPTLARGLFTEEVQPGAVPEAALETLGDEYAERIVARGYDKFFNIDEMTWTTVSDRVANRH
jgi:tRNA ligase